MPKLRRETFMDAIHQAEDNVNHAMRPIYKFLCPCSCEVPLLGQWMDEVSHAWQPRCRVCNRNFRATIEEVR